MAINYETAEEQHRAWMNSPTHRKNILNPNYTEIGVATARGYINNQPAFITVQVFGKPQQSSAVTSSVNTFNSLIKNSGSITSPANFSLAYNKTSYLKKYDDTNNPNLSKKETYRGELFTDNGIIKTIHAKQKEILWVAIMLLAIIIIRDLVLNSITNHSYRRHSTTNLILLLMLWSILIGL